MLSFTAFALGGLLHNKLYIAEEAVVEHKLTSFSDVESCSLPVSIDDRHGFCSEIASLKTDEGSVSFEVCRAFTELKLLKH